jgi:[ribosomal protein S5]-alanine N-acetyltransferase
VTAADRACPPPTTRLRLRAWRDDDLPLARALFGDARVTALVGGPFDGAHITARLASEIACQAAHGFSYWPLFAGDDFVGCCGLKPRDLPAHILELGFYVMPSHWGRGYATEAGTAVIAFAWSELGARGLFAGHHPDNAGSRAALAKLGFRYTHDELYPPTGRMHPGYELRPASSPY